MSTHMELWSALLVPKVSFEIVFQIRPQYEVFGISGWKINDLHNN